MPEYTEEDFAAAAKYVRHDYGKKTIAEVLEEYGLKKPEPENPDDLKPPPPKAEPDTPPKKKGVWWPAGGESE